MYYTGKQTKTKKIKQIQTKKEGRVSFTFIIEVIFNKLELVISRNGFPRFGF